MLKIVKNADELDWDRLMHIYAEGNLEKAQEYGSGGLRGAELAFYEYLREDFFVRPGAFYAIWQENGEDVSALRMEPYRDGFLLEALETAPEHRQKGYAKALILAVLEELSRQGEGKVYSHVAKNNVLSLRTHYACGFEQVLDYASYIDGTVTQKACTLRRLCRRASV